MLNAQAFATYSYGFCFFSNVVDSQGNPNKANACFIFHESHTAARTRTSLAMFEGKDTNNVEENINFVQLFSFLMVFHSFICRRFTIFVGKFSIILYPMSDYIIHNIDLAVSPLLDFDELVEPDKPVAKFPNYYLGKIIGDKGNELKLNRTRQNGGKEHVPNCVLRNEDGIALIRIHNKEDLTIVNLPQNSENVLGDCNVEPILSYPFGYVVVDYRDGKCQIAIEKTSSWDSKTVTIRNSLQDFFNENLTPKMGIITTLTEKKDIKDFDNFIDQRTIDHGDIIESFTFEYPNTRRKPTARIPETLQEEIDMHSKILEMYDAISGATTMQMGGVVDNEKLKQLSTVAVMSLDNAFNLKVKFRDYGEYNCNEGVVAKYPMNDVVISNFKDFIIPDVITIDFDLRTWLDDVFNRVKR